jgi:hypothetical protein
MKLKSVAVMLAVVVGLLSSTAAQGGAQGSSAGEKYIGTWSGKWEGDGRTGGFEITLEKSKDGTLGGGVSVTGEPTYKATLKTVSFDGAKMTATYDFPPDDSIGITLEAAFEATTAKGTWAARQKANGSELATGPWTVSLKK